MSHPRYYSVSIAKILTSIKKSLFANTGRVALPIHYSLIIIAGVGMLLSWRLIDIRTKLQLLLQYRRENTAFLSEQSAPFNQLGPTERTVDLPMGLHLRSFHGDTLICGIGIATRL